MSVFKITRRELMRSGSITAAAILVDSLPAFSLSPPPVAEGPAIQLTCEFLRDPLGLQTGTPRLAWTRLNIATAIQQTAYQVVVSSKLDGPADLWDSGRVDSDSMDISYAGKHIPPHTEAFWRVRTWDNSSINPSPWSQSARWSTGPAIEHDWACSQWIGRDDLLESTQDKMPGTPGLPKAPNFFPAPYLRKEFDTHKPIRSAFLYASGLGYAELWLNGEKLGDRTERDPGFTDFDKRVLYVTHDVTKQLKPGPNVLGAILGTGWYDVHDVATWHFNTAPWRKRPRLRLTLAITYLDGSQSFVISDNSWRCSSGPILRDGIYTGEVYDARLEMPGWNTASFDDSKWAAALLVEPPTGKLTPLPCEPVRRVTTITPIAITQPKPGVFIVNMGQNFSGHTQLSVRGPAGHAITMRYAELLNSNGTLNSAPIDHFMEPTGPRQPFQQDTYICKGIGELEVWEQRFSYSGFQYVEVTNFPGMPTLDNFRGIFAHTDLQPAGEFTCSDETVNKIQRATRQSYLSNAQSYPTDCPQREKNGWTGDAGIACECGLTNFHSTAFYAKWLDDFIDAQRPDGGLPVLVPNGGWGNGESWPGDLCPPWDAAYPIITWQLYRFTGDREILARHIAPLRRYVSFFLNHRKPNGLCPGLGIGDWSPWKTTTPQDYITNAYLFLDLDLMAKISGELGLSDESNRYRALANLTAAFLHKTYYDDATRRYSNGSQMAQGMALHFGFVPASERVKVFNELVGQIEALGHLDVGFLGAKFVLRALAEGGRVDLAFSIATRPEMPSYSFWVNNGSTTLWEGWRAGPSYNHIMFGDISPWFYNWIAGLQQAPDSIAFQSLLFRPNPVGGLTEAKATYLSPRGLIGSAWKLNGSCLNMTFDIPSGTSARVILPADMHFSQSGQSSAKASSPVERERSLPPGRHTLEAQPM